MPKRRTVSDYITELAIATPDRQIPLSQIHLPSSQPRRYFDPVKMELLIESVRKHGILQPLLVRSQELDMYELVAGERRYRAAVALTLATVPVTIRELGDNEARVLSLVENIQREDLNPVEETLGIITLLESQLGDQSATSLLYSMLNDKNRMTNNVVSQQREIVEEVFNDLSLNWESFVQHRLPILKLPADVLEALQQGQLEYTKARAIARIGDEVTRENLLTQTITQKLSLSQIKEAIAELKPKAPSLQKRLDGAVRKLKRSRCWEDEGKRIEIEALLEKLEKIIK